jgi:hypothetical protein
MQVLEQQQQNPLSNVSLRKEAVRYECLLSEIKAQPFLDYCRKRIDHDRNLIIGIVGETGSAKSSIALKIAEALDPHPETMSERIIFTFKDFAKLSHNQVLPKGSVIIFDEAGIELDNYTWYSEKNIRMSHILQTFRWQNLIVLFTCPLLKFISLKNRTLFHGTIETKNIDYINNIAYANFYLTKQGLFSKHPYSKSLRIIARDGTMRCASIGFGKPSVKLWNMYLKKKNSFVNKITHNMMTENYKVSDLDPKLAEKLKAIGGKEEMNLIEYKVYRLKHQGWMYQEIAKELEISQVQVKEYARKIQEKGYDIPRTVLTGRVKNVATLE